MRFLSALLFLLACSCCGAQEKAAPTGLKAAGEDLVSLLTFELDKKGAFRLKRDHWKASFEEPKPEPEKEDKPADGAAPKGRAARLQRMLDIQKRQVGGGGFGGFGGGMARQDPIHHKMINRVITQAGGRSRGRGMSGTSSDGRFRGPAVAARYKALNESLEFQLEEGTEELRWISVADDGPLTKLTLSSKSGFVWISRRKEGVQIASMIDGKSDYFAADSFQRLVHENKQYFKETLAPVLEGIAALPIEDALETQPGATSETPDFGDLEFPDGKLAEEKVRKALMPLVQFRIMDGRPRLHRETGDDDVLQKELATLKERHTELLEDSVKRLRAGGGTEFQVGELRRQMGLAVDQVSGRRFVQAVTVEAKMFGHFRGLVDDGFGSSGSGGGMGEWEQSFGDNRHDKGGVGGRIRVGASIQELEVKEGGLRISIVDNDNLTRIHCESDAGLIFLTQTQEPPRCEMAIIGGGKAISLSGDSFVSMLSSKQVSFRKYAVRTWSKYGLGGLDPFDKAVVKEVLSGIANPDRVPSAAESLVEDREYLTMLVKKVSDTDKAALEKHIAALKPASE